MSYLIRYFILSLFMVGFSGNAHSQNDATRIDSFFHLMEQHNKFMGSVAIRKGSDLAYSKAIGWASVEDSIPNDHDTKFRIGSVSKVFTAAMIFQMIEENAVALKTPLARFYPMIPNADSITIDHLLSHRSGIHNITSDADYMTYMIIGTTKEEMIDRIIQKGSDFQPGTQAQYSNSNYILLGYILETLTDLSYNESLQKRICIPLGLNNTYYEDSTELEQNENYSYRYTGKRWFPSPETDMSIPHGAGAIVSTAKDLTKFIHALFDLQIITRSSLDQMIEIRDGIGRGLFLYTQEQDTFYGHGGAIDGFHTQMYYSPYMNLSVAVCSNGLNYRNKLILDGTIDLYLEREFLMPTFIKAEDLPDSTEMVPFVGYYTCAEHPLDIELFIKEEQLYAKASGQSSFPLTWESKNVLTYPTANIVIDFSKFEKINGKFERFVIIQGKEFTFNRKTE